MVFYLTLIAVTQARWLREKNKATKHTCNIKMCYFDNRKMLDTEEFSMVKMKTELIYY